MVQLAKWDTFTHLTLRVFMLRRSSLVFWKANAMPPHFFILPAPIFLGKSCGKHAESWTKSENRQKIIDFAKKSIHKIFETVFRKTVWCICSPSRDLSIPHLCATLWGPEPRCASKKLPLEMKNVENSIGFFDFFPQVFLSWKCVFWTVLEL